MGFVNEYVSEEDIQKYKLDDLWNEFVLKDHQLKMPEYRKEGKIEYDWCIDRYENCWLMKLRSLLTYVEWIGRMISGPQSEFIFFYDNQYYILNLELLSLDDGSFEQKLIFIKNTKLMCIDPSNDLLVSLKKAICMYGRYGIRQTKLIDMVQLSED